MHIWMIGSENTGAGDIRVLSDPGAGDTLNVSTQSGGVYGVTLDDKADREPPIRTSAL